MAAQWALGAALVFTVTTIMRIRGTGRWWHPYVPGGIAVAVGESIPELDESTNVTDEFRHV
jgi:hypothetical protein